jgi:anti-sigma-K factor RskA
VSDETGSPDLHPHDDVAAYALDALDGDEAAEVEAHLATCPACRDELDDFRAALAALTTDEAPPPGVWAGIAHQIGADDAPTPLAAPPPVPPSRPPLRMAPDLPAGAPDTGAGAPPPAGGGPGPRPPGTVGPRPPTHLRPPRSGNRRWIAAALAIAAALVVVVGAVALVRRDNGPGSLDDVAQAALDAPGASVATLTTQNGTEVARLVTDGGTGYVFVDKLPALPQSQEYQLWKLGGPAPVSLGMVGDGRHPVAAVGVPAGTNQVALSVEPAGGSVAPTLVVATGRFA